MLNLSSVMRRPLVDSRDRFLVRRKLAESLDVRRVPDVVVRRFVPELVRVDLLCEEYSVSHSSK